MCDYSLRGMASRPAVIGDKLVSTGFYNFLTRGFAATGERDVAVCLRPGTELAFEAEVQFDPIFPLLPNRKVPHKVARFTQVNLNNPATHHDALEFPGGRVVLVASLCEGQRATVLQLPVARHPQTIEHEPLVQWPLPANLR